MTPPPRQLPFLTDPRFIVTSKRKISVPANAPFKDRAMWWWIGLQQKWRKPQPLNWSFGATPTTLCSLQLLSQCTEVTGVRYVIARDVAAGGVVFGHTNVLNGAQFVAAFTEALQTGKPGWWDQKTGKYRKENLVLLTNDPRTVLVLPQEMVAEFRPRKAH